MGHKNAAVQHHDSVDTAAAAVTADQENSVAKQRDFNTALELCEEKRAASEVAKNGACGIVSSW